MVNKERRNIAEITIDGDGRYSELIGVDKLRDGTYLVYEKEELYGFHGGFARVNRINLRNKTELNSAVIQYNKYAPNSSIVRDLNYMIFRKGN